MGAGVESAGLHSARAPAVGVLPPMCVHTPLLPGRAGVKCYCVVASPRGDEGARICGGGGARAGKRGVEGGSRQAREGQRARALARGSRQEARGGCCKRLNSHSPPVGVHRAQRSTLISTRARRGVQTNTSISWRW